MPHSHYSLSLCTFPQQHLGSMSFILNVYLFFIVFPLHIRHNQGLECGHPNERDGETETDEGLAAQHPTCRNQKDSDGHYPHNFDKEQTCGVDQEKREQRHHQHIVPNSASIGSCRQSRVSLSIPFCRLHLETVSFHPSIRRSSLCVSLLVQSKRKFF